MVSALCVGFSGSNSTRLLKAGHRRPHGRDRRAFVNREALRQILSQPERERAARPGRLSLGRPTGQEHESGQGERGEESGGSHTRTPSYPFTVRDRSLN